MASSIPVNPTPGNISQLLPKLSDPDSDFRYMALSDMLQMFNIASPTFLMHDYTLCSKIVDGLLITLVDKNGEVQNQAIKCLGPFVNKAPDTILSPLIERVSTMKSEDALDASIPSLGLREIVVSLPRPVLGMPRSKQILDAYAAISKTLIPRLVGRTVMPLGRKDYPSPPRGMLEDVIAEGTDNNAMDVLTEVARCFGAMLHEKEVEALLDAANRTLESPRAGSVLKKKAVTAISSLSPHFSDSLLSAFISRLIENLTDSNLIPSKRRMYLTILGSLARSIPKKFGPYLKTIAPFVLSALSAEELDDPGMESDDDTERDPEADEVREAALIALESFLSSCSADMRIYTDETIDAANRFIKYDPNLAQVDDDEDMDEEDEDALEGEDFEEEGGYDDEDDVSWKVRRSSAKVLRTLITTRGKGDLIEDGTLYAKVAPPLIARFKEREESVRLEILATLSALIRASRDDSQLASFALQEETTTGLMGPPPSRKRRRGGSDASMIDTYTNISVSLAFQSPTAPPLTGPRANLAKIVPDIVRNVSQLLNSGPLSTKQASIVLIKDIVLTQGGGLSGLLDQIMIPIMNTIAAAGSSSGTGIGSSSTVTANSLRIEALQTLGAILELHSAKELQPFMSKLVPTVIKMANDKYSKVCVEAVKTLEKAVIIQTPPRSPIPSSDSKDYIEQIFTLLSERAVSKNVDREVREQAVHALAVLLGLTSGTDIISTTNRRAGLDILLDRLRNELMRLATARSIGDLMSLTNNKGEVTTQWVTEVALELAAQLRKSSRTLRAASLEALYKLAANPAAREHLGSSTIVQVNADLLPVMTQNDLHLMYPAAKILTIFVANNGKQYVTDDVVGAVCTIVQSSVTGKAVEALTELVRAIGEQNSGRPLMTKLLQIGVAGNPNLLGKAIGTLLVFGKDVGVRLDQFITELQVQDDRKQCLALNVLGETALRSGANSQLKPELFMKKFSSPSEQVPLAAAVALGRAGAGNVNLYLPEILNAMHQTSSPQYLLMHAVKELLHYKTAESSVKPFASDLWEHLVAASQIEDNRAIGAECIGRIAIIDPQIYLPKLQVSLHVLTVLYMK
jgi:cullin-associated NEDD8-dissociated protein 1